MFELLSETVAYENAYFTILDRHYRLPNGHEHHFFVRKEVDTCCVLAMTKEGQFLAVQEYRVGPGKMLSGLPAGRLDGFDTDPDEQIRIELLEETGYQGEFKKVGVMPTSPYSTRMIHCYYAINCEKVSEQQLEPTEEIEVALLTPEEMSEQLLSGQSSSAAPGLLAWEWMKRDGHLSL